jgi:hypothetical protein
LGARSRWPAFTVLGWSANDELPAPDHRTKYQRAVDLAAKGWFPLGATNPTPGWLRPTIDLEVDRIAADIKRAADRYSIKQPVKVVTSVNALPLTDELLELYYGGIGRRWMTGIDPQTFPKVDERSKPVGLTTSHIYTDQDNDSIEVTQTSNAVACVTVNGGRAAYVKAEHSVPLALNVLGHDRPHSLTDYKATVGGQSAYSVTIESQAQRDRALAGAIASLKSVDRYDQKAAQRKAEAEAQAKRDAEYAKQKQESFDRAKQAYADAIRDQIASGIDAESAAKVQAALSAYETARRKLEGLPS